MSRPKILKTVFISFISREEMGTDVLASPRFLRYLRILEISKIIRLSKKTG